ncbi:hypothetical protein NX868_07440 [Burkholderia thailandensis]|uniref:Uncharacterized protein n=1 Tax=Burkholderia thailandensis TaxID=57975 RepID=A0AAW9CTC8_BURTH|nr:hypothetical protein [Burkholderia thailandensis]MCS3391664.1 hypothetical protein [Burkholderia thailandensis]MCS6452679.1 hypothetical protein [Burkholderia thailandensis]MCS6482115.1 hypothetical protein [Burkholderia thailandensis]MCS6487921.1 hypothetical protein [Burkholderia thailandensis]MDW9240253.1 hypothetical protein [Burkholderia thailandensis]
MPHDTRVCRASRPDAARPGVADDALERLPSERRSQIATRRCAARIPARRAQRHGGRPSNASTHATDASRAADDEKQKTRKAIAMRVSFTAAIFLELR